MTMWSRPGSPRRLGAALGMTLGMTLAIGLASGCGAGASHPASGAPVPLPAPLGHTQQIGQENLAYLWPLSVNHGTLECRGGDQAVFITPEGRPYALNDTAKAAGAADIEPIRLKGADHSAISLGALRSRALQLCQL